MPCTAASSFPPSIWLPNPLASAHGNVWIPAVTMFLSRYNLDSVHRLHQPQPTLDFPAPTAVTAFTTIFTRAPFNIPTSNLLAVPAQRSHSPLPIDVTVFVSRWQLPNNKNVLEPAFVPLADRLRSTAVEFQGHHSVAEDAFSPSTRVVATLSDIATSRSLFTIRCSLDVSLWRRWEPEKELLRSELQSHEAGYGNMRGDLLDEFGGKC